MQLALSRWIELNFYPTVISLKLNKLFLYFQHKTHGIRMYSFSFFSQFRANDGCLYVFDLEQNKRTLKVSMTVSPFCILLLALVVPVAESASCALFINQVEPDINRTL